MVFKDWLTQIKTSKPELSDFITQLNNYFSDTGFNTLEFEKEVKSNLLEIETSKKQSMANKKNA